MQVAGWKKTRFETRDGETIQGYNVYLVDHWASTVIFCAGLALITRKMIWR